MTEMAQAHQFRHAMGCLRKDRGLSQTGLAKMMASAGFQWHPMTTKRIELGEQPVKLVEALALAELLGSTVAEMTASSEFIVPRRDALITVFAYGLTEFEHDALFVRGADTAHALDQQVTCSSGPATDEYIRTLLGQESP